MTFFSTRKTFISDETYAWAYVTPEMVSHGGDGVHDLQNICMCV